MNASYPRVKTDAARIAIAGSMVLAVGLLRQSLILDLLEAMNPIAAG
jgi:hypothetical protein